MGHRKTILATNEIYHIYNRGVEKRALFLTRRDYQRLLDLINYYRFVNCPVKFSYFKKLSIEERDNIYRNLNQESKTLVEVLTFCLMPNHIHFLMKQVVDNGISKFMAKITNSFSHYFNIRNERQGHLFQGNFGAVRIEDDEQFLHVSRYIHLNPVTGYIIEVKDLPNYEHSSYPEYLGLKTGFTNTSEILSYFKNRKIYKQFVEDQADYARELDKIKHLVLE